VRFSIVLPQEFGPTTNPLENHSLVPLSFASTPKPSLYKEYYSNKPAISNALSQNIARSDYTLFPALPTPVDIALFSPKYSLNYSPIQIILRWA